MTCDDVLAERFHHGRRVQIGIFLAHRLERNVGHVLGVRQCGIDPHEDKRDAVRMLQVERSHVVSSSSVASTVQSEGYSKRTP